LSIKAFFFFCPKGEGMKHDTHTLEIVFFCTKTAQNRFLKRLQMFMP